MSSVTAYESVAGVSPDALVEKHAILVKRIASHLAARLPETVEIDDLIQVGLMALLEAARNYSETRGAKFETFASIRVRGAMLDEVRNQNWAPRSYFRKRRELSQAIRAVENRVGRPPESREVADELGVSIEDYNKLLADTSAGPLFSLDDDSEHTGRKEPEGRSDMDPRINLESEEFQDSIAECITRLPEREATVLALYYQEELHLKEIGEVLGVTESRVCQIHRQALARLRAQLTDWT
jgi:RNA polymerase sigma factor for flagellar operon FliA